MPDPAPSTAPSADDTLAQELRAAVSAGDFELHYQPKDCPELSDSQREEVTRFLQALDGHADVHRVYAALK